MPENGRFKLLKGVSLSKGETARDYVDEMWHLGRKGSLESVMVKNKIRLGLFVVLEIMRNCPSCCILIFSAKYLVCKHIPTGILRSYPSGFSGFYINWGFLSTLGGGLCLGVGQLQEPLASYDFWAVPWTKWAGMDGYLCLRCQTKRWNTTTPPTTTWNFTPKSMKCAENGRRCINVFTCWQFIMKLWMPSIFMLLVMRCQKHPKTTQNREETTISCDSPLLTCCTLTVKEYHPKKFGGWSNASLGERSEGLVSSHVPSLSKIKTHGNSMRICLSLLPMWQISQETLSRGCHMCGCLSRLPRS